MSDEVGSASVTISPDMSRFEDDLKAKLDAAMEQVGEELVRVGADIDESQVSEKGTEAGDTFAEPFKQTVKDKTSDTQVGPDDTSVVEKGSSTGGKFADALKARIQASLKDLPDITIGLNTTADDAKLAELRTRLDTLRNVTIGVDISDRDFLAAVALIQTQLAELGAKSTNIEVKTNALAAAAELETAKAASDDLSGRNGGGAAGLKKAMDDLKVSVDDTSGDSSGGGLMGFVKGLSSSSEGASSADSGMSPLIGTIMALGTALIPIAAVATGAAIGLVGMATAAVAGVGAFAIAAIPVYTQVSTALQTISADQAAVAAATNAKSKNTAILQLQTDVSNLNPMVAGLVASILQVKQQFMDWDTQFQPDILGVFGAAVSDVMPLLNSLTPLVHAGAGALKEFFTSIGNVTQTAAFQGFIDFLADNAGPAIESITGFLEHFGSGFASMLENSGPLIAMMENGLVSLGTDFENFAKSDSFKTFVEYVVKETPAVVSFFEALVSFGATLIGALTPIGDIVLPIVTDIIRFVTEMIKANPIMTEVALGAGVLAGAFMLLNIVLDANPIVLIILGLVALGFAIEELVTHWSSVWKTIKSTFDEAVSFLRSGLGSLALLILGPVGALLILALHWQAIWSSIRAVVNDAWHGIDNDVLHPLENWFTQSLPHALSLVSGFFTDAFQSIHNIVNTTWHAIDNDFVHPITNFFENTVPQIVDDVIGFFTALPGRVNHVWSDVVNALHGAWSEIANWVSANIVEPVVHFFEAIPGFVAHVWSDVVTALEGAWAAISGWVNDNVVTPVVSFFEGIPGFIAHVWSDVVSALEGAWNAITGWVHDNVTEPVIKFFESIPGGIAHVWSDVVSGLEGAWDAISSWVKSNVIDKVVQFFTDMPQNILNALSSLASIIEAPFQAALGVISSVVSTVEGWLGDIGIHIGSNTAAAQNLASTISAIPNAPDAPAPHNNATGTGSGTFQGLTWVGEQGPELVNYGSPVQIIPNNALGGMAPNQSSLNSMVSFMGAGDSGASGIGANLMMGMAQGIVGGAPATAGVAATAVNMIIAAANQAAGIASPSTVLMNTGQWMMQGLANGITSSTPIVTTAANAAAQAAIDAISAGIATGAGPGGIATGPNTTSPTSAQTAAGAMNLTPAQHDAELKAQDQVALAQAQLDAAVAANALGAVIVALKTKLADAQQSLSSLVASFGSGTTGPIPVTVVSPTTTTTVTPPSASSPPSVTIDPTATAATQLDTAVNLLATDLPVAITAVTQFNNAVNGVGHLSGEFKDLGTSMDNATDSAAKLNGQLASLAVTMDITVNGAAGAEAEALKEAGAQIVGLIQEALTGSNV